MKTLMISVFLNDIETIPVDTALSRSSAEQLRRDPVHQDLGADADDYAGDDA